VERVRAGLNVRISCLLGILLFSPCILLACSIFVPLRVVKQTFVVVVRDRGRQISGIDVKLLRWNEVNVQYEVVESVQSDVDGNARFSGVPLGEYRVRASHENIAGGELDVKIVARGKADDKLELTWPRAAVHEVRAVTGAFTIALTKEPLSRADLSLTDIETGRIVGSTIADHRGHFRFDGLRPGLYGLSISERKEEDRYLGILWDMAFGQRHHTPDRQSVEGNILIEVNPKAMDRGLPVGALSMTDCGMSYEAERTAAK
jgi:hypothetical protein